MINKKILVSIFLFNSILCQAAQENIPTSNEQNNDFFYHPHRVDRISQEVVKPTMIVANYTVEPTLAESVSALQRARVSTHYMIDTDGTIFETMHAVPKATTTIDPEYIQRRAWHAGHAYWDGKSDVNSHSIGVLFVNEGATPKDNPNVFTNDSSNTTQWFDFTDKQQTSFATLCQQLKETYNIADKDIVGHGEVAINPTTKSLGRKVGPGPRFPWKNLAQQGVGLFHNKSEEELAQPCSASVIEFQKSLQTYGYSVQVTGQEDEQTKQATLEFQIHHDPKNIDGNAKSCRNIRIINNLITQHVMKNISHLFTTDNEPK